MSSYDGEDIFGSGPHRITWEGQTVSRTEFSFPGQHYTATRSHGMKKQIGRIRGQLRADDVEELEELILVIKGYVADGAGYELVDNFDRSRLFVRLDNFIPGTRHWAGRDTDAEVWIQEYEVPLTDLYPLG